MWDYGSSCTLLQESLFQSDSKCRDPDSAGTQRFRIRNNYMRVKKETTHTTNSNDDIIEEALEACGFGTGPT